MNTEILRKLFQSKFDYTDYCNELVHKLFGCNDISTQPELLDTTAEGDKSYYIGRHTDTEGRELGFFYTKVAPGSDVCRKRVGLRKLVSPYLKYDVDAAIAVFADERHWRLSYICDMKDGITAAKRFSYILGEVHGQYKTPLERLEKIYNKGGRYVLNDLRNAFSVEALSKEFFDMYHYYYDSIVAELAHQGKSGAIYHDYVKKMMGRIVFLHFLQKKKWLNDNLYFLRDMFLFSPHQTDFLDEVLEPLFFGIFNTEQNKRAALFKERKWDAELLKQWQTLPYLNGGLFEEDEIDRMNITLPAKLFEDLFNDLALYNFTVDENDPDDAEIGVDPEMLGKIFESLLEDNKSKGAFYTPKEIVRYMCKESLIAHLSSKLPDVADSVVRTFVETHEMQPELEDYRQQLSAALREIKICDPAIGSGAFPMGLLNELWRCREALEPTEHRVVLKKEIIENNIYGVDIEKGAIDIARLRFWLSIVVDSEKPEALPNFDYKFMQGNSLIESFDGVDLSRMMSNESQLGRVSKGGSVVGTNQYGIEFASDDTKRNIQMQLKNYFSITDHHKKTEMRRSINDSVKNYIRQMGVTPSAENHLVSIDPSANQEFFLWHTWFKDIFDNGGFDIVIGNPPYGELRDLSDNQKDIMRFSKYYKYAQGGRINVFQYFYPLAIDVSRKSGIVSFIVQNSLMAEDTTFINRKTLLENCRIISLDSFPERYDINKRVFKSVTMSVCICMVSNIKSDNYYFPINIWRDKYKTNGKRLIISKSDIHSIYPESLIFPSCDQKSLSLLVKLKNTTNFHIKAQSGEIDMTKYKPYFTQNTKDIRVITGSNIAPYYVSENASFGKNYLLPQTFIESLSRIDINYCRIVLQRITGVNAKRRFIGGLLSTPNVLCANSTNYISSKNNNIDLLYLLGLLNSRLFTYYDKLTNTNANITAKVLNNLPVRIVPNQFEIIDLVKHILEIKQDNPSADTTDLEFEIDNLVYKIYGLTEEEIAVIEQGN